jgi:hypothetical protein
MSINKLNSCQKNSFKFNKLQQERPFSFIKNPGDATIFYIILLVIELHAQNQRTYPKLSQNNL